MTDQMEAIKDGMNGAVPFASHVGVEIETLEPGACTVRLPERDELRNHVGSQHAGSLFTAGETASGGAFVGAFAMEMGRLRPLVRDARIDYTRVALGEIVASARFTDGVDAVRERLEADGAVDFEVGVELTDAEGETVARMTVTWNVKQRSPAPA
jgi:acyl-coenzyme A thioesterase PaaI-like protein